MPNYEHARIYGIVDTRTGDVIYISGTCNQLSCRMGNHRSIVMHGPEARNGAWQPVHRYMHAEGVWNFGICEVEPFPCSGRRALRKREKELVVLRKCRFWNAQCMLDPGKYGAPVQCSCGATVTKGGLAQHRRTRKHALHVVAVAAKQAQPEPVQCVIRGDPEEADARGQTRIKAAARASAKDGQLGRETESGLLVGAPHAQVDLLDEPQAPL